VFTAGIGENSPIIRARIAEKACVARCCVLANRSFPGRRAALPSSSYRPTDEELMIAQHTFALVPQQTTRRIAGERLAT
jgi:acetate kinase